MFGHTSRQLLRVNRNFLRRTADPQDANTKMRTGPNYTGITALIIGVATAYGAFTYFQDEDAKKIVEKEEKKDLKNPSS
ncbi:hypothetical protein BDC45DRAFT_605783 [Circinella umbellata]|nr:hypothetical protein BDC45DRAFT_605783 [Circinella umbellata]